MPINYAPTIEASSPDKRVNYNLKDNNDGETENFKQGINFKQQREEYIELVSLIAAKCREFKNI